MIVDAKYVLKKVRGYQSELTQLMFLAQLPTLMFLTQLMTFFSETMRHSNVKSKAITSKN